MARTPKAVDNIQVFRGSRPREDVFSKNANSGCCGTGTQTDHDKLAGRTRFDNALAHSNPTGANDKFVVPYGDGFADARTNMINHINTFGVGAQISVLAIPTYAFVTGVGIHIAAQEAGLTFNLITRNGLVLPATAVIIVDAAAADAGCEVERTQTAGTIASFAGFGALGAGVLFRDIFGREGQGEFSLEADELILEVATVPAGGLVVGEFDITVSVSYDVIHRAEQ